MEFIGIFGRGECVAPDVETCEHHKSCLIVLREGADELCERVGILLESTSEALPGADYVLVLELGDFSEPDENQSDPAGKVRRELLAVSGAENEGVAQSLRLDVVGAVVSGLGIVEQVGRRRTRAAGSGQGDQRGKRNGA